MKKKEKVFQSPFEKQGTGSEGVKCVEMFMKLYIDLTVSGGISLPLCCAEQQQQK